MRCPNCKAPNLEGSLLCVKCGRALDGGVSLAKKSGTSDFAPSQTPQSGAAAPAASPSGGGVSLDTTQFVEGEIYRPSGKYERAGIPMMLVAGLMAGLLVGTIYHFIAQFFDLIFIFPLVAGLGAGLAVCFAVTKFRVRSPKLAGIIGAIAGLTIVLTMQIEGAYQMRPQMIDAITQGAMSQTAGTKGVNASQVRALIEAEFTPLETLRVYESVRGQAGSSIKGLQFSGFWFWLVEGGEALGMIAVAALVATGAASNTFCENCQQWHEDKAILKTHPQNNAQLWEKINARDWNGLMQTPRVVGADAKEVTTLSVSRCERCDCGTLSATSAGGTAIPEGINGLQLVPNSTRALLTAPTPDSSAPRANPSA